MKLLSFLTILLMLSGELVGQIAEWKAEEFVKGSQIDTFLIYSFRCGDEIPIVPDTCQSQSHYLLWKALGNYYLKKFETCGDYKTLKLDKPNPLTFYLSKRTIIDKEEVKPPSFYQVRIIGKRKHTIISTISVDHSCYCNFTLADSKDTMSKTASAYYLQFPEFEKGRRNVNYRHNQNSSFKLLIDQMSQLVKKMEAAKEFEQN